MADPLTPEGLKARIDALSPPDQIRLAADLVEAGRRDLAEVILEKVVHELQALRLFSPRPRRTRTRKDR